jgi:hypothetical protein
MKPRLLLCFILLAAFPACDSLPRDPDGTLDRVRAEHVFRVGMIASGEDRFQDGREQDFLRRVAAVANARPAIIEGSAEPLLVDLADGRLDLVIGMVSPESPWVGKVAILRPLGETVRGTKALLVPIARNGENRWIMLLEREARAVAADGGGA